MLFRCISIDNNCHTCYYIDTSLHLSWYKGFFIFGLKTRNETRLSWSSSGAKPEIMNTTTKNIINSFIIVPLVATTMSMNVFMTDINDSLAQIGNNVVNVDPVEAKLQIDRQEKAAKIDAYFAQKGLPLEGYGMSMVKAAEDSGLPYNLVAALAMRESTGGKFACHNNPFGWGSCRVKFSNFDDAIESVSEHLGGKISTTSHYYKGKSVRGILVTYNSVIPNYADQVMSIMTKIDNMEV